GIGLERQLHAGARLAMAAATGGCDREPPRGAAGSRTLQRRPEVAVVPDDRLPPGPAPVRLRYVAPVLFRVLFARCHSTGFAAACAAGVRADLRDHRAHLFGVLDKGIHAGDDARPRERRLGVETPPGLVQGEDDACCEFSNAARLSLPRGARFRALAGPIGTPSFPRGPRGCASSEKKVPSAIPSPVTCS